MDSFILDADNREELESFIDRKTNELGVRAWIGVCGWGRILQHSSEDPEFQEACDKAEKEIKSKVIDDLMKRLRDYSVGIVSGWTKWDVPWMAVKIAKKYDLPTIWVLPERGRKYSAADNLDVEVVVKPQYGESQFWDESQVLTKISDGNVIIGGWTGTLVEVAHTLKMNEALLKYGEMVKSIVPVSSAGGLGSMIHMLPWDIKVKAMTLPDREVKNGKEAFEVLRDKMGLDVLLSIDN